MTQINNLQDIEFDEWDIDIDEIITHYAIRGDFDIVHMLREAVDTYKREMMDGDYENINEIFLTDTSSDDDDDTVSENIQVQVTPDGFYELH